LVAFPFSQGVYGPSYRDKGVGDNFGRFRAASVD
jgi:hypothetical protein